MGDDSCLRGHGFGSQRRILDGHFFTLICCKICIVCLKGPKINEKKTGVGPFFKKTSLVPTFKMLQQRTESFCQFLAAKKLKKLSYGLTVKMILTLESFPNFRHLFFDVFWHHPLASALLHFWPARSSDFYLWRILGRSISTKIHLVGTIAGKKLHHKFTLQFFAWLAAYRTN